MTFMWYFYIHSSLISLYNCIHLLLFTKYFICFAICGHVNVLVCVCVGTQKLPIFTTNWFVFSPRPLQLSIWKHYCWFCACVMKRRNNNNKKKSCPTQKPTKTQWFHQNRRNICVYICGNYHWHNHKCTQNERYAIWFSTHVYKCNEMPKQCAHWRTPPPHYSRHHFNSWERFLSNQIPLANVCIYTFICCVAHLSTTPKSKW